MHNNFPGQYRRIAKYLHQFPEYQLAVATLETNQQQVTIPRIDYKPHREPTSGIHPAMVTPERGVLMGQAAYKALSEAKKTGTYPDIILSHSGWGASLFLKDIFPDAKLLNYFEWYYHAQYSDADFFNEQPYDPNKLINIRMKNSTILHDLAAMDWGQSPTNYQRNRFPERFRSDISVLHDGVETDKYKPNPEAVVEVTDGKTLTAKDEVVTYVARGMEEYRGFPQFMEMVANLQKRRPAMHVVMLGADRVAYGAPRPDGKSWKEWALETFDLDMSRVHMMGLQPFDYFQKLMQVSSCHVYLTAPFVLSWSLMEAMSSGCLIVASNVGCVREMIKHEHNGLLTSFWNIDALIEQVNDALSNQDSYVPLRRAARQTILDRYDIEDLLPKQRQLIETVANGSQPTL